MKIIWDYVHSFGSEWGLRNDYKLQLQDLPYKLYMLDEFKWKVFHENCKKNEKKLKAQKKECGSEKKNEQGMKLH